MNNDLFERAREKAEADALARAKAAQDNNSQAVDKILGDPSVPTRVKNALLRVLGIFTGGEDEDGD